LIDVLIGFYLATLITELFTTRLYRLLGWYALNSLFLGLIALVMGLNLGDKAMIISGSLTIIIKNLISIVKLPLIIIALSPRFKPMTTAIKPKKSEFRAYHPRSL